MCRTTSVQWATHAFWQCFRFACPDDKDNVDDHEDEEVDVDWGGGFGDAVHGAKLMMVVVAVVMMTRIQSTLLLLLPLLLHLLTANY